MNPNTFRFLLIFCFALTLNYVKADPQSDETLDCCKETVQKACKCNLNIKFVFH